MDVNTIFNWITPDRLVSLVILIGSIWAALSITKAAVRTALTAVAMLSVIFFLDPSLYAMLIVFLKGLWKSVFPQIRS